MPQDPTGSGSSSPSTCSSSSSSSSSSCSSVSSCSELAESDDRNDEDEADDDAEKKEPAVSHRQSVITDRAASRYQDPYENVITDQTPLEYLGQALETLYDPRTVPSRMIDPPTPTLPLKPAPAPGRLYEFQDRQYIETALTAEPVQDYNSSSSSSANSLDDLCRGHRQQMSIDFGQDAGNARDHFMIPTRDPRELNERILSLFNPQFLPNFNDMITYVAGQCETSRRSPPARSRSVADGQEGRFFANSGQQAKRAANSMFFKRGLTYQASRK